ncbi:unnamed protein product [Clavelina lepadiformis]|uniref:Centrosomal protein kizuna n=1 Tax=Clavelina lepadiformis TaxID=159417 RepID=A0ABP0FJT2_CLALP
MDRTEDIEFYERQINFEENLGKIQKERSKLEREFHTLVRNDKKLQSIRATKLRSYWRQVTEREKRARTRNEELIRDFSDMEERIALLQKERDKLQKTKKEYEAKVLKLYPKWRQEVEIARARKQLKDRGIDLTDPRVTKEMVDHTATSSQALAATESNVSLVNQNMVTSQMRGGPLFQLVPYDQSTSTNPTPHVCPDGEEKFLQPEFVETKRSPKSPSTDPNLDKASVSANSPSRVSIPPLELPSSAERQNVDSEVQISPVTQTSVEAKEPLSSANIPDAPSPTFSSFGTSSSEHDNPTPVTSTRHNPLQDSHIQRVEISNSGKTSPVHFAKPAVNEDLLDDLSISDISEVSSKPVQFRGNFSDAELLVTTEKPPSPRRMASVTHDANTDTITSISPVLMSPRRSVIKVPQAAHDNVESVFSESLTTETSHKTDLPLTSSAAYQELRKGHDFGSTLVGGGFSEEEDELEEVLSPKPANNYQLHDEDSEREQDSQVKALPVRPTTIDSESSETLTEPKQNIASSAPYKPMVKAPWDTDSDDDSFDSRDVARSNRLNDDDYDFYD